jgi:serine/threonine protein kinase
MFHYVPGLNLESSEYTSAVDIWALGCIMYRILTGKPPFLDLFSLQKYCNSPELLMPPISSFKTAATRREDSFVRLLLTPRPAARPSASVALQNSWFTISDQPNALTVTEVKQKFIYADSTNNPSRYPSTDIRLLPANEGNSESQFNYETASHAGLHSHYHQDLSQDMMVRPVEWPVADLPRMREPMPGAFDVKKFVSIGLPEDIKPTVNKQPNQRFGKPSVKLDGTLLLGDEWNSSDDNFDAEKPKQTFPSVKLKDVKEESDWERSPVDGVTGTRLPAGPSGFQHPPKMPELAILSEMSSMLSRVVSFSVKKLVFRSDTTLIEKILPWQSRKSTNSP